MILNLWSVVDLFLGGLSLAVGGILVGAGLRRARTEPSREMERPVLLLLLLGFAVAAVLSRWLLLHLVLWSFVPLFPGAICPYGVVNLHPWLARTALAAKPVALIAAGIALVRVRASRAGHAAPAGRALCAMAGALLAVDAGIDVAYLVTTRAGLEVSCCSTSVPTVVAEGRAPSLERVDPAWALAGTLAIAAALGLLAWTLAARRGLRLLIPLWVAELAALWLLAGRSMSPYLLGLEYHRCAYCLVGSGILPDAPFFAALLGLVETGTAVSLGARALAGRASGAGGAAATPFLADLGIYGRLSLVLALGIHVVGHLIGAVT